MHLLTYTAQKTVQNVLDLFVLTASTKPIVPVNCTAEESATIDTCGASLDTVAQDLADLFKGGLQSFIGNMNKLGPIFARGCNISNSFKSCARPVIKGSSSCQVRSSIHNR